MVKSEERNLKLRMTIEQKDKVIATQQAMTRSTKAGITHLPSTI